MKENDLFEIIGDIDDVKIEEAYKAKSIKRKTVFLKRFSFAACFVLVAVISFSVINKETQPKDRVTEKPQKDGAETGTDNDFEILIDTEINNDANVLPNTEKEEVSTDAVKPETSVIEDNTVNEETAREETSDQTSGGGGGGSSGGSTLKKESYSFDYLNSLHEKIKELAISEEFSFIVSSFVNEDTNRIEVVVTSMEKDKIDRIIALDTQGGAIEFKLSIEIQ